MSIVVLGDFSPRTFRADWFAEHGIIGSADRKDAITDIESDDIVAFHTTSLFVTVDRQRLRLQIVQEPYTTLLDMLLNMCPLIAETQVVAIGINTEWHAPLGSKERWHGLGDILVPKKPWGDYLTDGDQRPGGMHTVVVERSRDKLQGLTGYTRIHLQPSARVRFGLYCLINDHFSFPSDTVDSAKITATAGAIPSLLPECWRSHLKSDKVCTNLIENMLKTLP